MQTFIYKSQKLRSPNYKPLSTHFGKKTTYKSSPTGPSCSHIDAAQHRTHQQLTRKLQRLDNYLETVRTILEASLDPQAFPDLKADAVRFRGLGIMLTNLDSFKTDPTLATAIYRQLPSAQQEVDRILSKYDLLVRQETIPGIQLAGLDRYYQSKLKSFQAIAKQNQQALPQQIENSLNQIKQPALQSNGSNESPVDLQTQLRKINDNLELLEVLDPQASRLMMPQRKQLLELQARFQDIEPADNYSGNDRDDLLKTFAFFDHQPAGNNIRIPTTEWTRRTYWQYNGLQWREIDRSILRFYVSPPNSGNARSQWQEYSFSKDHLNDDKISVQSVQ